MKNLINTVKTMKSEKGNTATIAVIVVIVAISAGVVGWMLAKKSQSPTQQVIVAQPIAPVSQPGVQPAPASESLNLQKYTNTRYGFEFNYPENTRTQKLTSTNQYEEFDLENAQGKVTLKIRDWSIYKIEENTPGTFWEKLAKQKWRYFTLNLNKLNTGTCNEETKKYAPGINPMECTLEKGENYVKVNSEEMVIVYTKRLEISFSSSDLLMVDKMASTFKFTK